MNTENSNAIIPLQGLEKGKPTVNARDLHSFLEVGKDFSNWIKDRIKQYKFTECLDFEVFANSGENPKGGRPTSEYHLSLDMAKELAMVERNEKGRMARIYFIRCEDELRAQQHSIPGYAEALRLYADKVEEAERLRLTVQEQAPAVEFVQRYVRADGQFGIRETAKILELKQNFFVAMCIEKKVLFRENGSLQPYAEWIEKGYFVVKVGEANEHAFKQTRFTSKGVEWVRRYLDIPGLLAMAS